MKESRLYHHRLRQYRTGIMFLAPSIIMVLVFALYPMIDTVLLSLHKYNISMGVPRQFIGIENYISLIKDTDFFNAIKVTVIYTFWGVGFTMVFGVILALLLNREGRISGLLRAVSLMPMLICGAALSVAWTLMYNYSFGLLNAILTAVHLPKINFLGEVKYALPALITLDIWQFTPFVMILVLASLKGIPVELYEAASIDGANKVQSFFKITLPSIRGVLFTTLILRVIDTFKTFEKPYMMTNGGPAMTTNTVNLEVFKTAFSLWNIGYGSAGALIITLLIGLFSITFMKTADIKGGQE
ncbi:MAG: sugar ABC transporter permease [Treponema sp.]|jgi:multiple sugar transport system permease protein|nr:sugar ABC transporter permease [Treponema sp.]